MFNQSESSQINLIMGHVSDAVQSAKMWWQSKTIIGAILLFLPAVLKLVFPEQDIDLTEGIDTVWEGAEGVAEYADSIWANLQEALGFILVIWGRMKASVGIAPKVVSKKAF